MMRMQTALFCQLTDASTATPRGDAPSWRAAGELVEDAQIPWRSSAVLPQLLPASASGPQLTLSPGFTSQCFPVLFCSPLEALSLWQIDGVPGGVPSGRAAICPPPSTTHRKGWAPPALPGLRFSLLSLLRGANISGWDAGASKLCPNTPCPVKTQRGCPFAAGFAPICRKNNLFQGEPVPGGSRSPGCSSGFIFYPSLWLFPPLPAANQHSLQRAAANLQQELVCAGCGEGTPFQQLLWQQHQNTPFPKPPGIKRTQPRAPPTEEKLICSTCILLRIKKKKKVCLCVCVCVCVRARVCVYKYIYIFSPLKQLASLWE